VNNLDLALDIIDRQEKIQENRRKSKIEILLIREPDGNIFYRIPENMSRIKFDKIIADNSKEIEQWKKTKSMHMKI
jgi:hypothetical protein